MCMHQFFFWEGSHPWATLERKDVTAAVSERLSAVKTTGPNAQRSRVRWVFQLGCPSSSEPAWRHGALRFRPDARRWGWRNVASLGGSF
ncbi:hypothetical protein I7I50_12189 [Histoplasma capsulatum G186AR]|uniref:Uncharacterized protein n=1 Tax=Ajellomyces capsulatus TaxID=5037 RepID=A0A8H7YDZ9_AJECA|nr:hypothetical protein I7I52_11500 [Histoplasma capsulatum]QSS70534.1 hypothetical protein I7I50_12189 [Histoplasma capsulatum G186AR]